MPDPEPMGPEFDEGENRRLRPAQPARPPSAPASRLSRKSSEPAWQRAAVTIPLWQQLFTQ